MLDDRQTTVSSQWRDPVWPPASNQFGWSSYLGALSGHDVPYAAPRAQRICKVYRPRLSALERWTFLRTKMWITRLVYAMQAWKWSCMCILVRHTVLTA